MDRNEGVLVMLNILPGVKVEYRVIAADSTIVLTEAVNKASEEGWQLQGGVSVSVAVHNYGSAGNSETYIVYQAMYREIK